uniref:HAT C-terminal dimerisation domain-containing protein n=1 Tax=Ditylenchus dipsaci TaxID=166011 RepID=A0A915EHZ4_9BILA
MSLLWKLKPTEKPGRLLFNKLSSTESEAMQCAKKIPTSNKGVTNLKAHLRKHPQYKEQLAEREKADSSKKEAMQKGLQQLLIKGTVMPMFLWYFLKIALAKSRLPDRKDYTTLLAQTSHCRLWKRTRSDFCPSSDRENLKHVDPGGVERVPDVLEVLSVVARRYLSIPATSQPSEQLFSVARDIYEETIKFDTENAEMHVSSNKKSADVEYQY